MHGQQNIKKCSRETAGNYTINIFVIFASQGILFVYGPAAPSGPGTPHYRGFTIAFRHTLTGLLWTNDRPITETST